MKNPLKNAGIRRRACASQQELTMNVPSALQPAVEANLRVIEQGASLLNQLTRETYGARIPACFDASIGGHIRHIIDHYHAFLRGLDDGGINYEARSRDRGVETDPLHARDIFSEIAARLARAVANRRQPVLEYCAETTEGVAVATSVLRELEFLLSHTIHHYALVAVMAKLQGLSTDSTFGVAPSTLAFQQSQGVACAR
jgi:hypothetical protein